MSVALRETRVKDYMESDVWIPNYSPERYVRELDSMSETRL